MGLKNSDTPGYPKVVRLGVISRLTRYISSLIRSRIVALSRNDLVAALADKTGSTKKEVDEFVTAFADLVIESIANGEKVSIPGVLSVERVARAARTGRNPATGETINIPAGFGVKVSAGSRLKAAAK